MAVSDSYALVRLLLAATRLLRRLRWRSPIRAVRSAAWVTFLRTFHEELLPQLRNYALALTDLRDHNLAATALAQAVCSDSCAVMRRLLELNENDLHSCLKVFFRNDSNNGTDLVGTVARSQPADTRVTSLGRADLHPVAENSIWCSLLGRDDGYTSWKPLRCFACNDLFKHSAVFACTRKQWASLYRSVLVFPLMYPAAEAGQFEVVGFLVFDSRRENAFPGLPDVFEHRENLDAYHRRLAETATFQLGATIADTLAMFLRPAYERFNLRGGRS